MRRVLLPLTGLVAGTTLLISLKSAPGASRLPHEVAADALAAAEASASATAPAGTPSAVPESGATPDPVPPGSAAPEPGAPTPEQPPPAAGPTTGTTAPATPPPQQPPPPPPSGQSTVTGDSVYTDFGYVTVAITVGGGRMVDVVAVEMPSEQSRSATLSDRAAPLLREWALAAQSANIDTVSGATYTSVAYRESLQSALDRAGLA